jgi:Raf kinase inhibitor-like YbhB/YbcL family protein
MRLLSAFVVLCACAACHDSPTPAPTPSPPKGVTPAKLDVSSAAFAVGTPIPVQYTCDGASDRSPPLSWSELPNTAKTIALVVDDPDAPSGTFTHWIAWNIPPDTRTLADGANAPGVSGENDFGRAGYAGPCPPKGKLHHYHFKIFGLDTTLALKSGAKRADLDAAMASHVVAQGDLVGTFQH